jgi:hypothetical protein
VTAKSSRRAPPTVAVERNPATENSGDSAGEPWWLTGLAVVWLIGFNLFFYSFTMPNNDRLRRLDLWISLPDQLSFSELFSAQWSNLGQRAGIFGVATAAVFSAWGVGQLLLRLIRPSVSGNSTEGTVFAFALGLSGLSLATLSLGLAGLLHRWLFVSVCAAGPIGELVLRLRERSRAVAARIQAAPAAVVSNVRASRQADSETGKAPLPGRSPLLMIVLATMIPFVCVMGLGSMSPERDFDPLAYHLEGPKEFYQAGHISFLPHNVYTSFPFLSEMLVLLGMVLYGDWFWGALAGKCILFAFAPLAAVTVYAAGRRYFSPLAGMLAALILLSTPWIDRVSIMAYAEGSLTFFLAVTLLATLIAMERLRAGESAIGQVFLAGLLAGSGMACKYTGLVQVVAPMGVAVCGAAWFALGENPARPRNVLKAALTFAIGVALTIGPWLLKNAVETGNPVYPLAYNIFGSWAWSPELNARFVPAHSHHGYSLAALGQNALDVIADNDWSSPLLFGLAPLAFLVRKKRGVVIGLWVLVGYLFFAWWIFTHRLDRFWMPMIPVIALLAGVGATWSFGAVWRWPAVAAIVLALWFNFGLMAGHDVYGVCGYDMYGLCGYNAFLSDLPQARENAGYPFFTYMNQQLPKGAKVLDVGDGAVFNARFPIVYNTVFNNSIFQEWFAAPAPGVKERDLPLRSPKDILQTLHENGITHVYVCWDWIRRYREPGNYGFTEFVSPAQFDRLMHAGVLGQPVTIGMMSAQGMSTETISDLSNRIRKGLFVMGKDNLPILVTDLTAEISSNDRKTLKDWSAPLLTEADGHDVVINAQIFPVR